MYRPASRITSRTTAKKDGEVIDTEVTNTEITSTEITGANIIDTEVLKKKDSSTKRKMINKKLSDIKKSKIVTVRKTLNIKKSEIAETERIKTPKFVISSISESEGKDNSINVEKLHKNNTLLQEQLKQADQKLILLISATFVVYCFDQWIVDELFQHYSCM